MEIFYRGKPVYQELEKFYNKGSKGLEFWIKEALDLKSDEELLKTAIAYFCENHLNEVPEPKDVKFISELKKIGDEFFDDIISEYIDTVELESTNHVSFAGSFSADDSYSQDQLTGLGKLLQFCEESYPQLIDELFYTKNIWEWNVLDS